MKTIFLLIVITGFSITTLLFSQTTFQLAISYNNSGSANSIIRTTDNGYIIAGPGMYIVKIDSIGTIQWTRIVGGTNIDIAYSIIQTNDGGYAAAGYTESFGTGYRDMYIIKLNQSGSLQWNKTIGGTGYDEALSIIQTVDDGYVVAGSTNSFGADSLDMLVIKLDSIGSLQWSKTIGGTGNNFAYSIIRTTDGGFVMAGSTTSYGAGSRDFFIVKLDESGSLQWSKTIGGTGDDFATSIIQTIDGGYAVAGTTHSFGTYGIYVVKLDISGLFQWNKIIRESEPTSIIQSIDGGYAIAGFTTYYGAGNYDMYIVKLNSSGSVQWNKTIGGIGGELAFSITKAIDGGYVMAGINGFFWFWRNVHSKT